MYCNIQDLYQVKVDKGKVVSKMYKKEPGKYTCWKNPDCRKTKCVKEDCTFRVWQMKKGKKKYWKVMAPIIRVEAQKRGLSKKVKLIGSKATADRFQGVARRAHIGEELFKDNWNNYQYYLETGKLVKLLTLAETYGMEVAHDDINQKVEEEKQKMERKSFSKVFLIHAYFALNNAVVSVVMHYT